MMASKPHTIKQQMIAYHQQEAAGLRVWFSAREEQVRREAEENGGTYDREADQRHIARLSPESLPGQYRDKLAFHEAAVEYLIHA